MIWNENLSRLGENIYEAMKRAGMTQRWLAEEADIPLRTLSNWMRGMNEPGVIRMKQIANVLGCTVDDLLEGICDDDWK